MSARESNPEEAVRQSIAYVAPDADLDGMNPDRTLRDELGLDSMDLLEIITQIEERTGVTIPERDYEKVASLNELVAYVEKG